MSGPLIALITGGSGGMGRAISVGLAKMGIKVAVGYHQNLDNAQKTLNEVKASGGAGGIFKADLIKSEECEELINKVSSELGPVDILVNNAGTSLYKPLIDTTLSEWHELISLHLTGAFLCSKAVLPHMIQQRFGRIINISSVWGEVGGANEVAYSTVKAGLLGFTKSLAKEVGTANVTVNALTPGVIDTPMLKDFTLEEKSELAYRTPMGRLGTPGDVAAAVCFLVKPESGFITGQIIGVNGGFS
jgi:3-oxoacyl-[acyl-carrier protein] reductase